MMPAPKPNETYPGGDAYPNRQSEKMTTLQAHVALFDRDHDGIIWPIDTYIVSRALKFGILASMFFTVSLHLGMSYPTWGSFFPDPFFRIRVDLIHKAKHGSDTEAFSHLGDFDVKRFDYIFVKYSDPPHTHLTFWQIIKMLRGNFKPYDFNGWFVAIREWMFTYLLLWPADPRGMAREDVKGVFTGAMFYQVLGKVPPKS